MLTRNDLKKVTNKIVSYKQFGLCVVLAGILIIALILTPKLYSFSSFTNMLANNVVYTMLAVGVSFVLITGNIDISIGSIMAVSSVSVTKLLIAFPTVTNIAWIIAGIFIGCVCGFINGFLVSKIKIDSLIVTLATMYIFRGVAYLICQGKNFSLSDLTESFVSVTQTEVIGIKSIIWIMLLIALIVGVYLGLFRSGRRFYAVGTSEVSSKISGVNVDRVKITAFVLCGACAGLSGFLYASYFATITYDIGSGYEMTAMAICILGGVSITGGKGRIDGILIGAFILALTTHLLSLIEGFGIWQNFMKGTIIIVALIINLTDKYITDSKRLTRRGSK